MHRFQYKAYRRSFAGNFSNAKENFAKREGLLLRLEDSDGRVGFGEVCPIPSFGTESFGSAISVAEAIEENIEIETVLPKLKDYPCCLWGIESALEMIRREGRWPKLDNPWPVCGLVSDIADLNQIEEKLRFHYRCLKFKIGKKPMIEELRSLDKVIDLSDGAVKIRLDANGTLDAKAAKGWLERTASLPVEFLEQPLPKGQENEMVRLACDFPTPIALDESVASVDDLKRLRDSQWPGIYVIKPSLVGSRGSLLEEFEQGHLDAVFSSSLETKVGAMNALGFALEVGGNRRALGFGVDYLFADRNVGLELGPFLQPNELLKVEDFEKLWNRI